MLWKKLPIVLLLTAQLMSGAYLADGKEEKEKDESSKEEKVKDEKVKDESSKEEKVVVDNVRSSPHIIFILADDLGWNDVSFHGSPQIPTPNIDALAANALILHNYYTESQCTPSRAALLTGKYPIHIGLQHSVIKSGEPTGIPLNITIMPEYFKNKGYATHMVGKWHLGYSMKEYTPSYRGFDTFFGFYNEQIDYYDYTSFEKSENPSSKPFYGIDLQDGTDTIKNIRGRYATDVFTERALEIIENHNETNPLFLYMSHLACHSGNEYMPLQAPSRHITKNAHIKDLKRRVYSGVVSALDESVGKIIEALGRRGLLENSIIAFTSDNGGKSDGLQKGKASNWPLRGQKVNSWEGAVRVPCLLWSPLLGIKEPRISTQLMHVTDWLPTLYAAAGGNTRNLVKTDGYDLWKTLISNWPSPRLEILHNIDPISGVSALRRGDYKLIVGSSTSDNLWYGPTGFEDMDPPESMDDWVYKNDSIVKKVLEERGLWIGKGVDSWRSNATVHCIQPPPTPDGGCDPNKAPCLFNVAADPCEYNNLAQRYPRIVRSMLAILQKYNATAVDPLSTSSDPQADPRCHSFAHVPWLDQEFQTECPYI